MSARRDLHPFGELAMKAEFVSRWNALIAVLALSVGTANAAIYNLSFTDSSASYIVVSIPPDIFIVEAVANFNPITLFNGDTLNIQFQNVPTPGINGTTGIYFAAELQAGPDVGAQVQMSGLGPTVVMSMRGCPPGSCLYDSGIPLGSTASTSQTIEFASLLLITLQVLSGEPQGSAGLTVDRFSAIEAILPLPAALPLFATGLFGLGLLGWRRKQKAYKSCEGSAL